MDSFSSWLTGALAQASAAARAATVAAPAAAAAAAATPVAIPVAPAAVPMSLGLRVLLEPSTGGVIFRAASNTVATIYPVYASAKAIESKGTKDDVQWLTYWTLYGSLILAEHVADQALSRVPYYYHAKFAALLWLQLPQTQGAAFLYGKYYKPALAKYGPRIDAVLAKAQALLAAVYASYKVQFDAALALAAQARAQAAALIAWLLSDSNGGGKGAKANAA